jgi:26S proteasome regulatory subunit N8
MPGELSTTKVIIHPLVLLSVVDHYTRMSKIGNQKRVIGVLLGCWKQKGILDVSNSFAGEITSRLMNLDIY